MENEKIAVKGIIEKNKTAKIILTVSIVTIILSYLVPCIIYINDPHYHSFTDFYFEVCFSDCIYGYLLILGFLGAVAAVIIKHSTEKCAVTVTDKRVFGISQNKKSADIPLNQITDFHVCSFNGISISSMSGISNFYLIKNRDEVMKALSFLLSDSGPATSSTVERPETSGLDDTAESLLRLKTLLDDGVITQEEFDAKKKQILGL